MIDKKLFLGRTALSTGAVSLALGFAVAAAAPSFAQTSSTPTTSATADAAADSDVIVVTGSRIPRKDLDSAAPLAVVSAEEFKLTGAVNVEQVLNALPQVIPGTTSFSNNPGGGYATLNLRGLGSNRNLVLVNGRRWMFFDTSQTVDLNTIPQFLIEGVDVVTGGASAVYGSDAIAGVVNFRLKNNINGFEVGSSYNITERGDGARWDTHVAVGGEFADGRGHVTAYAEYYKRKAILQGARAFSRFTLADNVTGDGFTTGGSNTTPSGRFTANGFNTAIAAGNGLPAIAAGTLPLGFGTALCSGANCLAPQPNGTNAFGGTYSSSTSNIRQYVTANDIYNYAPANYLQVPQERWLLGAYGDYEITPGVTAYVEVSFVNNRVDNALAPTPVTGNFNVNLAAVAPFLSAADNATLATIDARETAINAARAARGLAPIYSGLAAGSNAAGVVQLGINRRISETGSRVSSDERNAFRTLIGVKGDIGTSLGLTYDAYYSYSRTRNANVQAGNISRRAFQAGLDGTAPAIDIFGPDALSPTSVNQISILAQNNDISVLQVANGSVGGHLFNFGLGGDDVGFVVGAEWRSLSSRFIPDTALSSGDVIGFNAGNPTQGRYSVKEGFGELRIPIASNQPFFHKLEVNLAGRYSDYSLKSVGGVGTYAAGVEWAPIKDITFRGQYSRAVRAPNVGELFGGLQTGFPGGTDPCTTAAALAAGALRNTCIATGAPAANLGQGVPSTLQPNVQFQSQSGGNANLNAEKADTYTFGVVLRPSFIPRLNITVDYFHIKIGNAILPAGGGATNILNLCYNVFQDPNNGFCKLVTRNQSTGAIDGTINSDGTAAVVFAGNANLSTLKTSGIDVGVDYNVPLSFGLIGEESKLSFSTQFTYTQHNQITQVNGLATVDECAGKFGQRICGNPQSKYKATTRLSFIDGPMTTSLRWRYLSAVRDDDDGTDYVVERLKAYNLFDLTVSYSINDHFDFTAGVNNIADKKPQLIGDNQEQANTYPGVYDVLGRDFFISANFRF